MSVADAAARLLAMAAASDRLPGLEREDIMAVCWALIGSGSTGGGGPTNGDHGEVTMPSHRYRADAGAAGREVAMTALKPCPFCGGGATHMHAVGHDTYVMCTGCDAVSPRLEASAEDATEVWNTRAKASSDDTRTWLAGVAMQGLLAGRVGDNREGCARVAVAYADALLDELAKGKGDD